MSEGTPPTRDTLIEKLRTYFTIGRASGCTEHELSRCIDDNHIPEDIKNPRLMFRIRKLLATMNNCAFRPIANDDGVEEITRALESTTIGL